MSASARPSATASLPEMRSSFSSDAAGAAVLATAMCAVSLDRLVLRVLARGGGPDLHAAAVEVLPELLVVLPAEAEAVRARRGRLVADLGDEPRLVGGLV